ncbi:MAG: CBS domain-containing protein [Desulfurococcales archaeon]|nr:CBS domain-containing protein [Desulfurococcales archaeon]
MASEKKDLGPPVSSLLAHSPIVLKPDNTVADAIRVMAEHNIGAVVIVDDKFRPIGIFTERDLLIKVCAKGLDPKSVKLEEVMTKDPVTISEDTPALQALEIMMNFGFRHLPVVDENGILVGVVSIRDLSKPMVEVDVSELHSAG